MSNHPMNKLLYSFGIIIFGLALGVTIQALHRNGTLRLPLPIAEIRKLLQKTALLGLLPLAIVGAIWIWTWQTPAGLSQPRF